MIYFISYDIADGKRRRRAARTLENYGLRVQLSFFECEMSEEQKAVLSWHCLRLLTRKRTRYLFIHCVKSVCRRRLQKGKVICFALLRIWLYDDAHYKVFGGV